VRHQLVEALEVMARGEDTAAVAMAVNNHMVTIVRMR
jgi:hypothetical protein